MAEVLVIGKKISEMDLVTDIVGDEKIPTGVVGDKAVTTGQLLTYLDNNGKVQWGHIEGDITNQADLHNQFTQQLTTLQTHIQDQGNPHNVTKDQVGLGSVDNTADMDKPVSTAVQEALTNKTHNSLLGRDAGGAHPAEAILDGSGVTQQQVNDLTGAPYRVKAGGYSIGERVVIGNGGIVQSVVSGNTVDPNTDMTGWIKTNATRHIFDENGNDQQEINDQYIDVALLMTDDAATNVNRLRESIEIAKTLNKGIRCAPRGIVRINQDIDFTGVNYIDFQATIRTPVEAGSHCTVTWGGTAISGAPSTIRFKEIGTGTSLITDKPTFRVFGAKQAFIYIGSSNYVQLYADAATSIRNSVAYNQIFLSGIIRLFEITDSGVGSGWINENTIKGGRLVKVRIVGKSYSHNHNHFDRNCIEGVLADLYFERAWENRFTNQRFEGVNVGCINFGEGTFCNHVVGSWVGSGSLRSYFSSSRKGIDLGRGNTVTTDKVNSYEQIQLWAYSENTPIYGNSNGEHVADNRIAKAFRSAGKPNISAKTYGVLFPAWHYIGVSDLIPVDKNTAVNFQAETVDVNDTPFRMTVQIFDSNKKLITDDASHLTMVGGTNNGGSISQGTGLSSKSLEVGFAVETDVVKYIKVAIYTSSSVKLKSIAAYLYRPRGVSDRNGDAFLTSKDRSHFVSGEVTKYRGEEGLSVFDTKFNEANVCTFYREQTIVSSSSNTKVTVQSATGLSVGDVIGVELANDNIHWSKIQSITGEEIQIRNSMPSAALTDGRVYVSRWSSKYATQTTSFTASVGQTVSITTPVEGAKVGDKVIVKYKSPLLGCNLYGNVESDGVVSIYFSNPTSASVTTVSGVLDILVK